MGQRLTGDDFNSLFRYFTRTAFRLETQPIYTVTEEQPSVQRFLAGDLHPVDEYPPMAAWLDQIRTLTRAGKRVQRVRILDVTAGVHCRSPAAGRRNRAGLRPNDGRARPRRVRSVPVE